VGRDPDVDEPERAAGVGGRPPEPGAALTDGLGLGTTTRVGGGEGRAVTPPPEEPPDTGGRMSTGRREDVAPPRAPDDAGGGGSDGLRCSTGRSGPAEPARPGSAALGRVGSVAPGRACGISGCVGARRTAAPGVCRVVAGGSTAGLGLLRGSE
jgi:hypothetical protein